MKNRWLWIVLGVVAFASTGVGLVNTAINNLIATFQNVKVRITGTGIRRKVRLTMNYRLENQNSVRLTIRNFSGTYIFQGKSVLPFQTGQFSIAPGETKTLSIVSEAGAIDIIGSAISVLSQIISTRSINNEIIVQGEIQTDFAQLPNIPVYAAVPLIA